MGFTYNQQYLHFNKSGIIYSFYLIDKSIFFKIIKNDQVYSTVKVTDNAIDYCVDMDNTGGFHLVSISASGELKYCIHRDNKWDCRSLTKYDARYNRFKNLKIFVVDNNIHILMAVSNIINLELWTLKHHYWNNQVWVNNKVCDIVTEKYDIPFYADMDSNNNIHIVYKSLYHMKYEIYYCRYNELYNSWNFPQLISNGSETNSQPFIFCDDHHCAHVVWSRFNNNNLEICYSFNKKVNSFQNCWSPIKRLSNEGANCTHPYFIQIDNCIKIIWKQSNHFFQRALNDSDDSFSEIIEIPFDSATKLSAVSVLGNRYKEYAQIRIPISYGIIDQEIFLIGLDENTLDTSQNDMDQLINGEKEDLDNSPSPLIMDDMERDETYIKDRGEVSDPVEKATEDILDKDHQIKDLMNIMNNIQEEQRDIKQLIKQLKIQHEINENRMEELIDLYEDLYEDFKLSNNTVFKKFKKLFR